MCILESFSQKHFYEYQEDKKRYSVSKSTKAILPKNAITKWLNFEFCYYFYSQFGGKNILKTCRGYCKKSFKINTELLLEIAASWLLLSFIQTLYEDKGKLKSQLT